MLAGQWAAGSQGGQILINNQPIVAGSPGPNLFTPLTITSGFVPGVNKLDFVVQNFAAGPTGLRVDLSGTADPTPVLTSLTASPGTINEGDTTTLTGTFAEDGPPSTHTVVISWGPGQSNTTLMLAAGVNNFSSSHLYPDNQPGNAPFAIAATVTDSSGESGGSSTSVTVNNVAPSNIEVSLTPSSINEGDTVSLNGSFTDPGVLDTNTVVINWGEGEDSTTLNLPAGVLTFSASHAYMNDAPPGAFLVEVTVDDNDPLVAAGPPSASNLQFSQLNWYDTNQTLQVPNSSWGEVEVDVVGDPNQPDYLNVVADAGNGPAWIIQNMPIFGDLTSEAAYFDSTQLGLSEGTPLTSLKYVSSVDAAPQTTAPSGTMTAVPVAAIPEMISTDGSSGKDPPGGVGKPSPFRVPGNAPVTNLIEYNDVPGVNEDQGMCMPGAFARSLIYLFDHNKKPLTKGDLDPNATSPTQEANGQDAYNALVAKIGGPGINGTDNDPSRVNVKAGFLNDLAKKKGLQAQTVAFDPNNNLGTLSNVTKTTETNFLTWVRDQLMKGEDVELSWLWPGTSGSHIVTVVGIYDSGGMTYLKYRDDGPQGLNGQHTDHDTKVDGQLTTDKNGNYLFMGHSIKFALSESLGQAVEDPRNPPPGVKGGSATPQGGGSFKSIVAGVPVDFQTTFTDPGPKDTHTATIDWGDGTSSPGVVTEPDVANGLPGIVTGCHTYSQAGQFSITAAVSDEGGAVGSSSLTISVQAASVPSPPPVDLFALLARELIDEVMLALDLSFFIKAPGLAIANPALAGQFEGSISALNADLQANALFQTPLGRLIGLETLAISFNSLTSDGSLAE